MLVNNKCLYSYAFEFESKPLYVSVLDTYSCSCCELSMVVHEWDFLQKSTSVNDSNTSRPTDVAKTLLDKTRPADGARVSTLHDPDVFLSLSVLIRRYHPALSECLCVLVKHVLSCSGDACCCLSTYIVNLLPLYSGL